MFDLDIPKIGYVIAVKYEPEIKRDWLMNLIYKRQKKMGMPDDAAKYIHVEISSGGKDSMRITPPRAKLVDITKHYKGRYIKILKYMGDNFDEKYRYKVACLYNLLCNKGYDYRGIVRFILPWVRQATARPFCSEGCSSAFKKVYQDFMGTFKPSEIMPAHFITYPDFEIHWEGRIV